MGSHLCRALVARGYEVTCVDRLSGGYAPGAGPDALDELTEVHGVRVVHSDLVGGRLEPVLADATAVIHLAALPGVRAGHSPAELFLQNALATARTLAALRRGQRLVLASTSSVYGDGVPLPTPEGWPPSPVSAYGVSKLAAEHACLRAVAEGADAVIARLFTLFGPAQRPDMAFARWIDAIHGDRPILWCARPGARRDFTFVDDAVCGLIAALERGRRGGTYNIGGGGATAVTDALRLIEREVGRVARIRRVPAGVCESRVTSACTECARRELGYVPRISLEEGIRRQVVAAKRAAEVGIRVP